MSRELPILMNAEMVRAILDGKKTQARRPVKREHLNDLHALYPYDGSRPAPEFWRHCPFGQSGDRLYMRETWWAVEREDRGIGNQFVMFNDEWKDNVPDESAPLRPCSKPERWGRRPSIHMPKEHTRVWLPVKRVWVERVQDISADDASAEGMVAGLVLEQTAMLLTGTTNMEDCAAEMTKATFHSYWEHIYGKTVYAWDKNPWVWGCEFEVEAKGEDR